MRDMYPEYVEASNELFRLRSLNAELLEALKHLCRRAPDQWPEWGELEGLIAKAEGKPFWGKGDEEGEA